MARKNNSSQRRKTFTLEEKVKIVKHSEANPHLTRKEIAQRFGMSVGSVSSLLKNKPTILQSLEVITSTGVINKKNVMRQRKTEEFEAKLYEWFVNSRHQNKPVTNEGLQITALQLAKEYSLDKFKASYTWITSFKARFHIKSRMISGEENLISPVVLASEFEDFKSIMDQYNDEDIFNADETALYSNAQPKVC